MTGIGDAMISKAVDCASWPADLHVIVDGVMAAIDAGADLSTEQAIGLGILISRSSPAAMPPSDDPVSMEQIVFPALEMDDAAEFLEIFGYLMSIKRTMKFALSGPSFAADDVKKLEDALDGFTRLFIATKWPKSANPIPQD